MARCKNCGVDYLNWKLQDEQCAMYTLMDADDIPHACRRQDINREQQRLKDEADAAARALQRHRESSGYI